MLKEKTKKDMLMIFSRNANDTGSSELQIAILTQRINDLEVHLKNNKKDLHSTYGLKKIISKRKKLMKYLARKNRPVFDSVTTQLGIRTSSFKI